MEGCGSRIERKRHAMSREGDTKGKRAHRLAR